MQKYIITISRQFGSMGRTIAAGLSERLDIEYLDRDIVAETAKRMEQSVASISEIEEKVGAFYMRKRNPFSMGFYSFEDEVFAVQRNIIRDIASHKSCIIVGRCADSILRDFENCLNIYIYAPYQARLDNCINELLMDEKTARKMIKEVDAARTNYQRKYCPEVTSVFDNKDIMIDSSRFGIEKTTELLTNLVKSMW